MWNQLVDGRSRLNSRKTSVCFPDAFRAAIHDVGLTTWHPWRLDLAICSCHNCDKDKDNTHTDLRSHDESLFLGQVMIDFFMVRFRVIYKQAKPNI